MRTVAGVRTSLPHVLAGLLIAAVNMRIAIASVGPLIEGLRADTGMSSSLAGALTTIPYACMGLFSFTGPGLVRRMGTQHVLTAALALIGAGALLRAAMPTPALLLAATLPIGVGIALAGIAIPMVIKHHFADRAGEVTGLYSSSMAAGIVVAGFAAVPLAAALGGWRGAFAISALPAIAAIPFWLAIRVSDHREPGVGRSRMLRISPTRDALLLGTFFGLDTLCVTGMVSWGAAVYEDAGWRPEDAAAAIWSIGLMTVVASLTVPRWRLGDPRTRLAAMAALMTVGLAGIALAPTSAAALWLVAFGFGSGAVLALALNLPLELQPRPDQVGDLSAWMLGLGLTIGALGPVIVGVLRDASGDFLLPMAALTLASLTHVFLAFLIPSGRQ